MEVALKFSHLGFVTRFRSLAAALALGATLVGCADIITYSKDARKEGLKLYNQQQYADAAGAFRNAVRQNPLDYQSLCYLGESEEQLGQHEQAIHAFRTSLEVMSKDVIGSGDDRIPAECSQRPGRRDRQVRTRAMRKPTTSKAARANDSPEEWLPAGQNFRRSAGDPDSAIDAYNHAMLTDPQNFHIAKEYGLYLVRLGQGKQAETPLRKAYAMNPDDAEVGNALRSIGVIPGPALQDEDALAKPIIPRGPLPEFLDINKITGHGETDSNGASGKGLRATELSNVKMIFQKPTAPRWVFFFRHEPTAHSSAYPPPGAA